MNIKYLKGWITSKNINHEKWVSEWCKTAVEAEEKNRELVVFEIPKNSNLINQIETLLQESIS